MSWEGGAAGSWASLSPACPRPTQGQTCSVIHKPSSKEAGQVRAGSQQSCPCSSCRVCGACSHPTFQFPTVKGEQIEAPFRCSGQNSALPLALLEAPGVHSRPYLSHGPEGGSRRKWNRLVTSGGCELSRPGWSEQPTPLQWVREMAGDGCGLLLRRG